MAYAAVLSLQRALQNLVISPRISVSALSELSIENTWDKLNSLRKVLKRLDATSKGSSRKNVNALDAQIKEAVWQFEDLLESHLYHQLLPQSHSDRILHVEVNPQELSLDIDRFIEMLDGKEEEYTTELVNLDMFPEEEEAAPQTAADSGEGRKSKRVGTSSDMFFEWIRTELDLSKSVRVNVVRVIGMAGIGKTDLARGFFDDPLIFTELEFDCRAWVTLGRKPDELGTIKRDILTQLDPASRDRKIRERDVEHLLKGIFKGKRFLLVLDDAWDTQVLDALKPLFPDYGGGKTLVLLTTRLARAVHEYERGVFEVGYELKLLDEDESWDLLRQSVLFDEEEGECPEELIKSGKKIAQKCDGLPLMILAVAALLSEAEMTAEFWEEVAEKANNHPIFTAAYDQLYEVLLPSYEYLPQHLKPCFLQLGVCPPYREISRDKLWCLWASEGFLENHFHTYVKGLIDHSIVMVCRTSSRNKYSMKTCRLHSTFWHLCRREATNTKFCRVLTSRDDGLQHLKIKGQRRLSFLNNILLAMKDVVDSVEEACASSARSLYCYGPYHPYPLPVCFGLRLLKVLDALALRFYEFPEQVMQLVYLKYLALTCNSALSPSISRLWYLRFLIIHRSQSIKLSRVTPYVPVEIWDMMPLVYIKIEGWNLPNPPIGSNGVEDEDEASSSSLERLERLKGVGAETCTKEVLERIPNLVKLGILIESSPDVDDMEQVSDYLSNIHLLCKLTSLTCVVSNPILTKGKGVVAPVSMFLPSLRKLSLSGMGYPWKCMNIIGSLPNLEVLKLRCYAFRGPKWVVRYGEFPALEFLLIDGTDLVHFEVKDRGFFHLKTFSLQDCYKLKQLLWEPDPGYTVTFRVFDCSLAVTTFAREMRSRCKSHSQNLHDVYVESSWE